MSIEERRYFRLLLVAIVLGATLFTPGARSNAQSYETLENPYIGVAIGIGGNHNLGDVPHTYDGTQPAAGRFAVWNILGDPEVSDDNSSTLTFSYTTVPFYPVTIPGDRWSCFRLWIDGAPFDYGGNAAVYGEPNDGFWATVPYIPTEDRVITSAYYAGSSDADFNDPLLEYIPVKFEQTVTLMHDLVKFQLDITNEDILPHMVGVHLVNDYLTSIMDDGTDGLANIPYLPGKGILENRQVLFGSDVPDVFEAFNSATDPVKSIRAIFRGNGATPPEVFGSDEWGTLSSDVWAYNLVGINQVAWSYEPIPLHTVYDVCYGAWWKPAVMRPGQKRTIIHYFGNACATHDFTKPNPASVQYVATVQGPRTLKYYADVNGISAVSPNPFKITAYMGSIRKRIDLQDVSLTLLLPPGLELDPSENYKYSKTISFSPAYEEAKVDWLVRPVGNPTGILTYSVAFSATPVGGTTVSRTINIPATDKQQLTEDWQMISVPFELYSAEPQTTLGLPDNTDPNNPAWRLFRYDTYSGRYIETLNLRPGEAYWLWLDMGQLTNMNLYRPDGHVNYFAKQWSGTQGTYLPLRPGWNMIGNPYVYAITLGELRVYHQQYGSLTLDEAAAKGILYKTLFWYDPIFGRYNWSSRSATQLKPWQGYWIRVLRDGASLVLTPVTQIGASVAGEPITPPGGGPIPP